MFKNFMCLITVALMSGTVLAGPTKGTCTGVYRGQKIVFKGLILNMSDTDTGRGSISVGGRVVAAFEGEDLRINYLFQTFKVRNNHGDLVEGRVNNIIRQTGVIKRLYVPGYGIDYRNIPMACTQN
jgi:hypothetical protein